MCSKDLKLSVGLFADLNHFKGDVFTLPVTIEPKDEPLGTSGFLQKRLLDVLRVLQHQERQAIVAQCSVRHPCGCRGRVEP